MAKKQAKKHPLYDNPRSHADAPDDVTGEGGDHDVEDKEREKLRAKHEEEWKANPKATLQEIEKIQRRHSQEKEDLEFDIENDPSAPPDSPAGKKRAARDADRAGARE